VRGNYRISTGSAAVAARLAATLLGDHAGRPLPGLVLDVGGGWVQLDETAMDSLRGRKVTVRSGVEVLTADEGTFEVLPL